MGYYARDEHYEPRLESGYEKGCRDTKDEMQETIDELVEALRGVVGVFSDMTYDSETAEILMGALDAIKNAEAAK